MERLPDEDGIDGVVLERDLVGGPAERLRLGHDALEHGPHPRQRLDREHTRESRHELPRQLAGAGGEVEHDCVRWQVDGVERRLRVARTPSSYSSAMRPKLPARSVIYPTPARRNARLSRSISRAITRRWTSCVPS